MRLFADDSVIYRKITSLEDQKALHKDLVRVFDLAERWGMSFNVKLQCKHHYFTATLRAETLFPRTKLPNTWVLPSHLT